MNESIINLITIAVTSGVSAWFGWYAQKRNKQTEAQKNEIDSAERVLKYYREMVDDLGQRLMEAINELAEARKAIYELEQKVEALTTELIKYKQLNGKK